MLLQKHYLAILHLLLVGTYCKDFLIETKDQADVVDINTPSKGAKSADFLPANQADVHLTTTFHHDLHKPAKAPSPRPAKAPSPKQAKAPHPKPAKTPSPKFTKAPSPKPANAPSPKPAKVPSPKPAKALDPKPAKSPSSKPAKAPSPKPAKAPSPKPAKLPSPKPADPLPLKKSGKSKPNAAGVRKIEFFGALPNSLDTLKPKYAKHKPDQDYMRFK